MLSVLLTGCVVLKSDYEVVVAERDATLAELQSTKNQLNSAQAEVSSLRTEVSSLKAQASDLNTKLEKRLQQLSDVGQSLDSLEPKLQMQQLLAQFSNKSRWYKVEGLSWSEFSGWARGTFRPDMEKYLETVDKPELRTLYDDAIVWEADSWTTYFSRFENLLNKLEELVEADWNELRAALAD